MKHREEMIMKQGRPGADVLESEYSPINVQGR
jgi:hypothetical protein